MVFDIEKKPILDIAAIDDNGGSLTYGELVLMRKELSGLLPSRELVFCLCENRVGALAGFIGLYDCGDVCLLLDAGVDYGLLQSMCETYRPSYFWMPENRVTDFQNKVIYCYKGYALCSTGNRVCEMNPRLSLLMTTSGTTGSPKLVRHKYGNVESNAKNVATAFGWTPDERGIIDLPMQYTMGLNVICSHLLVGATVLLSSNSLLNPKFWSFIETQKGTNFTGVPFSYEILNRLHFTERETPFLTTMAEGGGKLPDSLFVAFAEYAEKHGKRFFATYGTTETTARIAFLPPELATKKCGSIGKAIPGGTIKLNDEFGEEIVESEKEGELIYEGPNVVMGYANCITDLLKGDEFFGVYHTGDMAKMDADGFFYIVGRKKRFLKLYGLRVSLDQCERIVSDNFDIECACTGNDARMKVFITEKELKEDVKKLLSDKTGLKSSVFEINYIESIPRFQSGKINYKQLD